MPVSSSGVSGTTSDSTRTLTVVITLPSGSVDVAWWQSGLVNVCGLDGGRGSYAIVGEAQTDSSGKTTTHGVAHIPYDGLPQRFWLAVSLPDNNATGSGVLDRDQLGWSGNVALITLQAKPVSGAGGIDWGGMGADWNSFWGGIGAGINKSWSDFIGGLQKLGISLPDPISWLGALAAKFFWMIVVVCIIVLVIIIIAFIVFGHIMRGPQATPSASADFAAGVREGVRLTQTMIGQVGATPGAVAVTGAAPTAQSGAQAPSHAATQVAQLAPLVTALA